MYALAFQRLIIEALVDIFYFPIWWYSFGAVKAGEWCFGLFKEGNMRLAPGIWLANIFVPMFGQYDWQGRFISLIMRTVQVVFRSVALFAWGFICFALFIIWLILPLLIGYGFYRSLIKG